MYLDAPQVRLVLLLVRNCTAFDFIIVWTLDCDVGDLAISHHLLHSMENFITWQAVSFAKDFKFSLQSLNLLLVIWLDFHLNAVQAEILYDLIVCNLCIKVSLLFMFDRTLTTSITTLNSLCLRYQRQVYLLILQLALFVVFFNFKSKIMIRYYLIAGNVHQILGY